MDNGEDAYKVCWVVVGEAPTGFKCNFCRSEAKWVIQNATSSERRMVCNDCLKGLGAIDLEAFKLQQLKTLVDRLREAGLSTKRFILIKARDKIPVMASGFYENLLEPDDPVFIQHLAKGGNYADAAGDGLTQIETDGEPLASILKARLKTFTVISGGSKMPHFRIIVDDLPADLNKDKIPLFYGFEEDKNGNLMPKHIGVVLIRNSYLVGPGCVHPHGGLYTISLDVPIAKVSWKDLEEVLKPFMLESFHEARRRIERAAEPERRLNIPIEKVLEAYGVKGLKKSGEQLYGPHPVHGSATGRNFWVHIGKGVWYCFRCQSGGGPISLLAVLEGLITCDEARKGLDRELYRKCLEKAVEKGLLSREALEKATAEPSELDFSEVEKYAEKVRCQDLHEMVNHVIGDIRKLLMSLKPREDDLSWFRKMKTEEKASTLSNVLRVLFDFVYIPPMEPLGEPNVYVVYDNVLYDIDAVTSRIVGALIYEGLARKGLETEVKATLYSITNMTSWDQVDPWDYLKLNNGVLDLKELKVVNDSRYCFRYRLNISISDDDLREIRDGGYKIEDNMVYKYWRRHFEDEDWEHLTSGLGTLLAPHRSKYVGFLIGPRDSGKSTLLRNLTRPISPIVAYASLRSLTGYTFGLEHIIGKQVNVYAERGDVVLKNLDIINNLVGEHDFINVQRKFKPATVIRSLKAMFFSMNDPPILLEYGGETLRAFLGRLSIIHMRRPEDFKPIPNLTVEPVEAFKFLLWCRKKLEDDNWEIKKMAEEEMLDYLMKNTNTTFRFLESEYVVEDVNGRVKGTDLYNAYVTWCKDKGITPMSLQNFYTSVSTKYTKYERDKSVWFKGLRLYQGRLS
jgi:hypothetical protein